MDSREKKVIAYSLRCSYPHFDAVNGRTIEAFSIFKKGIRPEWEDPENRDGAGLTCRKSFSPNEVDRHWENMVFGIIGEMIDVSNEICGCRVIDKSKKGTQRTLFKLEIWLRTGRAEVGERIKKNLLDVLADGEGLKAKNLPEFEFKPHNVGMK